MEKTLIKEIICTFNFNDGLYYHKTKIHECEKTKDGYYFFPFNEKDILISLSTEIKLFTGIDNFSCSYFTSNISESFEKEIFSKMHNLIHDKCKKLKNILDKANSLDFKNI